MTGPDDDFGGGYEEYEPSPYNGDDRDGDEFDTFGPEEVSEEDTEESDEDSDEEPSEEDFDGPGGEDSFLDSMMEDRISGFSGFEMGE